MKKLSLITLTALLGLASCGHFTKTCCSKDKCHKKEKMSHDHCKKDKKECKDHCDKKSKTEKKS